MTQRIGFVGLGMMGGAIARRALEAPVAVTIYARRAEVRDEFAGLGAKAASSLAELAQSSDVVVVCVFDDEQLLDVVGGDDGLLAAMAPGAVLVSHTTGSPHTIRCLAGEGEKRGVAVLDAPVSGDPADIPKGKLTVMVGGDAAEVERTRPVFDTYAGNVIPVGPVGSAMAVKLVNNLLMAATLQLGQQALLVGKGLGADVEAMKAVIPVSSGGSFAFDVAARFDSVERLTALAAGYLRKDIDLAVGVMREAGVDPGILEYTAEHGPLDYTPPD